MDSAHTGFSEALLNKVEVEVTEYWEQDRSKLGLQFT